MVDEDLKDKLTLSMMLSIVPSTGSLIEEKAVEWPAFMASTISRVVHVSCVMRCRYTPWMNWDNKTPLLPRAPQKDPFAKMPNASPKCSGGTSPIRSKPEVRVASMFVPVSPSGTGNTFIRLIVCWWILRAA